MVLTGVKGIPHLHQKQIKEQRKLNPVPATPPSEAAGDYPHSDAATVKLGNSVRVRAGVPCPDYNNLSLAGWQGRVFESESTTEGKLFIGIRWDSQTLRGIPAHYIIDSEKEGLDWTEMNMFLEDIEPAEPRDTEQDAERVAEEMQQKYYWPGEGEQGERIYKVIAQVDAGNDVRCYEAWIAHLRETLIFPFEAVVVESKDGWLFKCGDQLTVTGIDEFVDDSYAVLVEFAKGEEAYTYPLCKLEPVDKTSRNYTAVEDFGVWFANR